MSCSSCAYLDESKKKDGGSSGCIYYCKKNKCFVNGCNNSCNNYKSSYRSNYECSRIYNEGKGYCDDTTPISFYLVILIGLVILGLTLKKGCSKDCIKVYEYDLLKCRGIAGEEVLEKVSEPIDFIGEDSELYYKECEENKIYDWFIYLKNGQVIGNITADRQIEDINSIEIAYNLHPDYWEKGYMTEAVSAVINYLFDIGYDNIISGYDEGNYKSMNLGKKLGFELYKINKNSYKKNGVDIDSYVTILNKYDWYGRHKVL